MDRGVGQLSLLLVLLAKSVSAIEEVGNPPLLVEGWECDF